MRLHDAIRSGDAPQAFLTILSPLGRARETFEPTSEFLKCPTIFAHVAREGPGRYENSIKDVKLTDFPVLQGEFSDAEDINWESFDHGRLDPAAREESTKLQAEALVETLSKISTAHFVRTGSEYRASCPEHLISDVRDRLNPGVR